MQDIRKTWLTISLFTVAVGPAVWVAARAAAEPVENRHREADLPQDVDVGESCVASPAFERDATSGFIIGGKNETSLIETLTELNGHKIAELEAEMRPGASSYDGFLGADESLLEVLSADNRYVVDELGLTHQELARHLQALAAIGWRQLERDERGAPFTYRGRRFRISIAVTRGSQPSPFNDGTESGANAILENLDNGQQLAFGLLLPTMIGRYGFYEGHGTPYRVEPREVIELLDFLTR